MTKQEYLQHWQGYMNNHLPFKVYKEWLADTRALPDDKPVNKLQVKKEIARHVKPEMSTTEIFKDATK